GSHGCCGLCFHLPSPAVSLPSVPQQPGDMGCPSIAPSTCSAALFYPLSGFIPSILSPRLSIWTSYSV
ncbi:hypothetical protein P7K49_004409, partial [Saguinus oedipus]